MAHIHPSNPQTLNSKGGLRCLPPAVSYHRLKAVVELHDSDCVKNSLAARLGIRGKRPP